MGQIPSDIRAELDEIRARGGNETEALSYNTDAPARVGDSVDDKKQAVKDRVSGAKNRVSGTKDATLKDTAERNPLGLAIGGAAIGFVAGLLLPSTRLEDKQMGEMSDKVIDVAKETASDALESGKQIAHDATENAKDQGQELASNLQERTQDVAGSRAS